MCGSVRTGTRRGDQQKTFKENAFGGVIRGSCTGKQRDVAIKKVDNDVGMREALVDGATFACELTLW
jgi:hypothetical protein